MSNEEFIGETVEEALRVYDSDKRNKTFKLKNYLSTNDKGCWYRFKDGSQIVYDFKRN